MSARARADKLRKCLTPCRSGRRKVEERAGTADVDIRAGRGAALSRPPRSSSSAGVRRSRPPSPRLRARLSASSAWSTVAGSSVGAGSACSDSDSAGAVRRRGRGRGPPGSGPTRSVVRTGTQPAARARAGAIGGVLDVESLGDSTSTAGAAARCGRGCRLGCRLGRSRAPRGRTATRGSTGRRLWRGWPSYRSRAPRASGRLHLGVGSGVGSTAARRARWPLSLQETQRPLRPGARRLRRGGSWLGRREVEERPAAQVDRGRVRQAHWALSRWKTQRPLRAQASSPPAPTRSTHRRPRAGRPPLARQRPAREPRCRRGRLPAQVRGRRRERASPRWWRARPWLPAGSRQGRAPARACRGRRASHRSRGPSRLGGGLLLGGRLGRGRGGCLVLRCLRLRGGGVEERPAGERLGRLLLGRLVGLGCRRLRGRRGVDSDPEDAGSAAGADSSEPGCRRATSPGRLGGGTDVGGLGDGVLGDGDVTGLRLVLGRHVGGGRTAQHQQKQRQRPVQRQAPSPGRPWSPARP